MRRPSSARRALRRRWILAAAWAAVVLGGGAFLILRATLREERIRAWIHAAADPALRGKLSFSSIEVRPWTLALRVRDVSLLGPEGETILRADRIAIVPRLSSLLAGRLEAREVVLEGPEAQLLRRADGSWNLADAFAPGFFSSLASTGGPPRCPALRIRAGKVTVRDERQSPHGEAGPPLPPRRLELNDLSFAAEEGRGEVLFEGEARLDFIPRLRVVRGSWRPAANAVACEVRAAKVDLSGPVDRFLEEPAAGFVRGLDLRGFADVEKALVRYDAAGGFEAEAVEGRLIGCQLAPRGFPFPLKQVGGAFRVRGRTIELSDLTGDLGAGRVDLSAAATLGGAGGIERLRLEARAEAIPLDHRLRALLPGDAGDAFDRFRPRGSVGVELHLKDGPFPPALSAIEASVSFQGVEIDSRDVSYRLEDLRGSAVLRDGRLVLGSWRARDREGRTVTAAPLTARHRGASFTVGGQADLSEVLEAARAPGGKPEVRDLDLEVKGENVAVDDEAREAIPREARPLWDSFQPGGLLGITLTLRRRPGDAAITPAVYVDLKAGRICYARFPYAVTDIAGRISFDIPRRTVTLSDLKGRHGDHPVEAKGWVVWTKPEQFQIDLSCPDLSPDDDLRAALPPDTRALLEETRFQGRVRADIGIYSLPEGGTWVKAEVDIKEGQVSYVHFPYALPLAGGHITATGAENLQFRDLVTRAAGPDGKPEKPQVKFSGGIGVKDGERLLDFHFDIEDLAVDGKLLDALPPELSRFVRTIGLRGAFQGELEGHFASSVDDPERRRIAYSARGVRARDAAVDFGIRLQELDAEGGFSGRRDESGVHSFGGQVQVKSSLFNRIHLRDADITFSFGKQHPFIEAIGAGKAPAGVLLPSPSMVARLAPDRVRDCFQMQVRKSNLYGGNARGFLSIDVGPLHDLMGEFKADGVRVALAAPDVFGVNEAGTSGEAWGEVSFRGRTGDSRSVNGRGKATISRARLVELPLFMGILSFLYGEFSSEHFFNDVSLDFKIADGKFRAPHPEGLAIRSQGVHLKGGGTMDFQGNLDISLSPEFLRLKIPLVDQVFGIVKKVLAQVNVIGDIAKPRVYFATGVGMLQVPIDARSKKPDRPLPRELEAPRPPRVGDPLPPPPAPTPPPPKPAETKPAETKTQDAKATP